MKKAKAKAKKSSFGVPVPYPPVSAMFTADGVMLTVIEGKKIYYKILSWKDLYKLGKKGKKMTPPDMVKQMTDKLDEMMVQREKGDAERRKMFEGLKTPIRVGPQPAVMPVPPYRRPASQAQPGPVVGETTLAPDPMANLFKDVPMPPPPPPSSAAGN